MFLNDRVLNFINNCILDDSLSLFVYRLPHTQDYGLLLSKQKENQQFLSLKDLPQQKGFVFSPFHADEKYPIHFCPFFVHLKGLEAIESYALSHPLREQTKAIIKYTPQIEESTSASSYAKTFTRFIQPLQYGVLTKLVLACKSHVEWTEKINLAKSFSNACERYPYSMAYLCKINASTIWMGCTPEILLQGNEGRYTTMALAGTMTAKEQSKGWSDKNKQEQQYVNDYISRVLSTLSTTVEMSNTHTMKAGDLIHLCTTFHFTLDGSKHLVSLMNELHPTPAVCGLPKQKALDFILENEVGERAYYAGFLGYYDPLGETQLYVNLRCAQIDEEGFMCYGGGGILPSSSCKEEWNEAQAKMNIIKSIVTT